MEQGTRTVTKLNPVGEVKIRYQGEVIKASPEEVVLLASWTLPARDLGYTVFEPGDRFTEYYFTNRWFNIFDIADAHGRRKGWYCNVAEPAVFIDDRIEQIDLLLDVWVDPAGDIQILDEDEFAADATLSDEQREGARLGLQNLLLRIAEQEEPFVYGI
ncbi:MAG TPA: DUF402 domain-containing protein [Ktedonobacteraceae bacterium]|nr:DUF402 domain-containing protein [Ktedonobacteraceae bacterium]